MWIKLEACLVFKNIFSISTLTSGKTAPRRGVTWPSQHVDSNPGPLVSCPRSECPMGLRCRAARPAWAARRAWAARHAWAAGLSPGVRMFSPSGFCSVGPWKLVTLLLPSLFRLRIPASCCHRFVNAEPRYLSSMQSCVAARICLACSAGTREAERCSDLQRPLRLAFPLSGLVRFAGVFCCSVISIPCSEICKARFSPSFPAWIYLLISYRHSGLCM